jgi:cysteine desulfurase
MRRIYLDHNAGAPQHADVTRAMLACFEEDCGNPSSVHEAGRRGRERLEQARHEVAALLQADPAGLVLTSGATEANNLALRGRAGIAPGGRHLVVAAVEHPSVREVAAAVEAAGGALSWVPVDGEGRVDPAAVATAVTEATCLVSVQLANPETGVLQGLAAIADRLRPLGVPLHADAAQAVGRLRVSVDELGVDLLTISGHKMGGPRGTGALWVRRGCALQPQQAGGGQERGMRAGTENVPGAVGLAAAARLAARTIGNGAQIAARRDRLEAGLIRLWPGAAVHGAGAARLPNTCCICLPGLDGDLAVARLDLDGVAVSMGSACSVGTQRPSEVLRVMGVSEERARASLRFSLGPDTRDDEIEEALARFARAFVHDEVGRRKR